MGKIKTRNKKKASPSLSANDEVKLTDAFEAYALWNSIPNILKSMKPKDRKDMGFDINDPLFNVLIKIRFKTDFAKQFEVSRDVLNDWEKREDFQNKVADLNKQNNVLRFEKDVDLAFTKKTIRVGDAHRVKLWKQLHKGWVENQKVEHTGNITVISKDYKNA